MIPVKICGITNIEDALLSVGYGAAALGFIFAPSKRQIIPEQARQIIRRLPSGVKTVGVFVDEAIEVVQAIRRDCRLDFVQLHGTETPEYCQSCGGRIIKVFKAGADSRPNQAWNHTNLYAVLIDGADGGSGLTFDWRIFDAFRHLPFPKILAGGLNPQNLEDAVKLVSPDAVDVSSGLEMIPGRKDPMKLKQFLEIASGLNGRLMDEAISIFT